MTGIAHMVAQLLSVVGHSASGRGGRQPKFDIPVRREIARLLAEGGLTHQQIADQVGQGVKRHHVSEVARRARRGRGHIDT